ncbi:MAG: hypothetical protein K2L72_01445 [Clostridia bacterium]|nr:hypothetical protein [Clostridia bacterium]
MRNKSVAVLDIRSSEICAAIAEKGVNNTFIIKSKYSQPYEGYAEGELLDVNDFIVAVREAVAGILNSAETPVKSIYVGVPCEFTEDVQTDKVLSFQSAQKISQRHLKNITANSLPAVGKGKKVIGYGALYYVLSDKRRVMQPVGTVSDSLRARYSFFVCKEAFVETVIRALSGFPTIKVFNWLSQNYTEGLYLFGPGDRDGYKILFDFGFISSTFSVVCGDGIAFSEAFSVGVGHIAVLLMEALDIPYEVALELLTRINLNAKDRLSTKEEYGVNGEIYTFSPSELRELVREGLDGVCSMLETCIQSFAPKDLTGAPIYVTGEGIGVIRGTIEHFSSRLVTPVEVVAPKVPYYDKPQFSSLFSLLSAALSEADQ